MNDKTVYAGEAWESRLDQLQRTSYCLALGNSALSNACNKPTLYACRMCRQPICQECRPTHSCFVLEASA